MNELKFLSEAKKSYAQLIIGEENAENKIRGIIENLNSIMEEAFQETSITEAGQRWFRQQNAKPPQGFNKDKRDLKTRINEFDFNQPFEDNIKYLKKLIKDAEIFVQSGVGRYITG